MAYIGVTSTSSSSITVKLYGLDTEYSRTDRVCTWYLDGVYDGTSSLGANVSSGGSYTFENLEAGTSYDISVSITGDDWDYEVELEITAETDEASVEPWSWTASNGDATAAQTKSAYEAVTSQGSLEDFSYLVWNDLVDKVKEVLDATDDSWDSTYASYSDTLMTSSDKVLTAARFNSLRYNIGSHYSTGITDVSKGDIIYGSYFTTLTNSLNSWIEG